MNHLQRFREKLSLDSNRHSERSARDCAFQDLFRKVAETRETQMEAVEAHRGQLAKRLRIQERRLEDLGVNAAAEQRLA